MAWLSGWEYRKQITASRPSGAVTNYQLKLLIGQSSGAAGEEVDCGGNCLSTFADLRFTASDGTTLLDYWLEGTSGSSPNKLATVWVEFDSIGTGDTTFYMYYGKSDATTASNGDNTFTFFDAFDSFNTSLWDANSSSSYASSGIMFVESTPGGSFQGITTDSIFSVGKRLRSQLYYPSTTGFYTTFGFVSEKTGSLAAPAVGLYGCYNSGGVDAFWVRTTTANSTLIDNLSSGGSSYLKQEITWRSGEAKYYRSDVLQATSTTNVPTSDLYVGCGAYDHTGYAAMTWLFVSEFVSSEPTVTAWGSEVKFSDVFESVSSEDSAISIVTALMSVSESTTAEDSAISIISVLTNISESTTAVDAVSGNKNVETGDVAESVAGEDSCVGYVDASICGVVEASESIEVVAVYAITYCSVSESSESTEVVVCGYQITTNVAESSESLDAMEPDVTGTFSVTTDFLEVSITGSTGNTGALVVESEFSEFESVGSSGIAGSCEYTTKAASFSSLGIVDSIGILTALSQFPQFAVTGITDNLGDFVVTVPLFRFGATGVQDVTGAAAFISEFSEFAVTGTVDCIGRLVVTSQFPVVIFTGSHSVVVLTYCFDLVQKSLMSTFTNYGFNSFAVINKVPVGASSSGLFSLTGATDNGASISSTVTFPLGKFGVSNEKQLRAVKLFGRTSGSLTITALDGNGNSWAVVVDGNEDLTAETLLGYFPFTARGRYLQIKIENNAGCDFLLDQVNLALYNLGRM